MTEQVETTTDRRTDQINLSDVAAGKVKSLLEQEGRDDLALRISVQPGGCSGLRYQLFFDERTLDGDVTTDFDGVTVVVDRMSVPYLNGARSTSSTRSRSRASRSTTPTPPARARAETRSTEPAQHRRRPPPSAGAFVVSTWVRLSRRCRCSAFARRAAASLTRISRLRDLARVVLEADARRGR